MKWILIWIITSFLALIVYAQLRERWHRYKPSPKRCVNYAGDRPPNPQDVLFMIPARHYLVIYDEKHNPLNFLK